MKSICRIPGCGGYVNARDLCSKHYQRWQTHGDPMVTVVAPKGSGYTTVHGYREIAGEKEHVLIVERVLGRKLPLGVEVHHFNEIKSDNRNENLVVCPDRAYHQLLHVRQKALKECGNANWRRCAHCRRYDDPSALKTDSYRFYHAACRKQYDHGKYERAKARQC